MCQQSCDRCLGHLLSFLSYSVFRSQYKPLFRHRDASATPSMTPKLVLYTCLAQSLKWGVRGDSLQLDKHVNCGYESMFYNILSIREGVALGEYTLEMLPSLKSVTLGSWLYGVDKSQSHVIPYIIKPQTTNESGIKFQSTQTKPLLGDCLFIVHSGRHY